MLHCVTSFSIHFRLLQVSVYCCFEIAGSRFDSLSQSQAVLLGGNDGHNMMHPQFTNMTSGGYALSRAFTNLLQHRRDLQRRHNGEGSLSEAIFYHYGEAI